MKRDKAKKEELKETAEEQKHCDCSKEQECGCDGACECGDCTCDKDSCSDTQKLQDTISELQNKLLYKDAEFINFRRRKEEETASLLKYANQDLILDILNSVDNFERAIESIKKDDEKDHEKMLTGIEMIYNELKATLQKYGVEEISSVDVPFDASIHHAVMTDEVKEKEDDLVLEVMMKGYKLKDRVIRPAMVKVNKLS